MNPAEITKEQFHALSVEDADALYLSTLSSSDVDNATILRLQEWEIDPENPRLTEADKEFIAEWRAEEAFRKLQDEASKYAAQFYTEYVEPLIDEGFTLHEALITVIESYSRKEQN